MSGQCTPPNHGSFGYQKQKGLSRVWYVSYVDFRISHFSMTGARTGGVVLGKAGDEVGPKLRVVVAVHDALAQVQPRWQPGVPIAVQGPRMPRGHEKHQPAQRLRFRGCEAPRLILTVNPGPAVNKDTVVGILNIVVSLLSHINQRRSKRGKC